MTDQLAFELHYTPETYGPDADEMAFEVTEGEHMVSEPYLTILREWWEEIGSPDPLRIIIAAPGNDITPAGRVSICVNDSCRVSLFREDPSMSRRRCPGCGTFAHSKSSLDQSAWSPEEVDDTPESARRMD